MKTSFTGSTADNPRPMELFGHRVRWSAAWMMANTGLAKALGFTAQIAVGWFLSQHDFALYAIAISVSSFAALFGDSGLRNLLIQRHSDYDQLEGRIFWLSLTLNSCAALVLAGMAPLVARLHAEPKLSSILMVSAVATVLATPAGVLSAKLRVNLQFKALSLIQIASSFIRHGSIVILAWLGYGPLSFVIPAVLTNLFEGLATWGVVRTTPWRKPFDFRLWGSTLQETRWILAGTFGIGILNNGLYFGLGGLVPTTVVGVYYFAYQVIVQVGLLLSHNLFQVLFPTFSQLIHDPLRTRSAIDRSLRIAMVAAALSLILVPIYSPLEQLIWKGKWIDTVHPVQILGFFYPVSVLLSVAMASQSALGRFRESAIMTLTFAVGTISAGLVGAVLSQSAVGIAIGYGVFSCLGSVVYLVITLREFQIPLRPIMASLFKIWGLGVISAGAALMLDTTLLNTWATALRIVCVALVFLGIFLLSMRALLPAQIEGAAEIIPAQCRMVFLGIMKLRAPRPAP